MYIFFRNLADKKKRVMVIIMLFQFRRETKRRFFSNFRSKTTPLKTAETQNLRKKLLLPPAVAFFSMFFSRINHC